MLRFLKEISKLDLIVRRRILESLGDENYVFEWALKITHYHLSLMKYHEPRTNEKKTHSTSTLVDIISHTILARRSWWLTNSNQRWNMYKQIHVGKTNFCYSIFNWAISYLGIKAEHYFQNLAKACHIDKVLPIKFIHHFFYF